MAISKANTVDFDDEAANLAERASRSLGSISELELVKYALRLLVDAIERAEFARDMKRMAKDPQIQAINKEIEETCSGCLLDGLEIDFDPL